MSLHIIKEYVADSAVLVSELLKVDVEIVDNNVERVAGTGYYEKTARVISDGIIYREALSTGKYVVIQNPRKHGLCEGCQNRDRCLEKMEIAHPITLNGEIIGAIGLICSTASQKSRLMENIRDHMFLVTATCEFIAAKLEDTLRLRSQAEQLAQLEQLLAEGAMHNEKNDEMGDEIRHISDLEKIEIERALNKFGRDTEGKRRAAKSLGIGIATLYRKLER